MKFMLNLTTENEAFQPDPAPEIARILRGIADRIEAGGEYEFFQTILDLNGNDVGRYALKPLDYR